MSNTSFYPQPHGSRITDPPVPVCEEETKTNGNPKLHQLNPQFPLDRSLGRAAGALQPGTSTML
jgi:hypothetical protein